MSAKIRWSLSSSLVLILLAVTCHANPFTVRRSGSAKPLMQTKAATQLYTLETTIGTTPTWVPIDCAVDGDGYVYVIDGKTTSIRKLPPSGAVTAMSRSWGTYGVGNGEFRDPRAIAVDVMSYVYVLDAERHNIQKFTRQGIYLRQWRVQGGDPVGMAIAASGLIYVLSDDGNVYMYGPMGNYRGQFHHSGNRPRGLALDNASNVYILDAEPAIYKYNGAGVFASKIFSGSQDEYDFYSSRIAIFGSKIYVSSDNGGPGKNMLLTFSLAGVPGTPYVPFGGANGQAITCTGLATDSAGNVYYADMIQARVQKLTALGVYSRQWGYVGTATSQFRGPIGATGDSAGNLYVLDCFNQRVQKFSSGAAYVSSFGSFGTGNGQFQFPVGIASGPSNSIYVSDMGAARVQKFVGGVFSSKFGAPGSGNGQFQGAGGVAVTATGTAYVADMGNHRIQYFNSSGVYTGQFGAAALRSPWGVALSGSTVCVTDEELTKVMKFGLTGTAAGSFGSQGDLYGQFEDIKGISADSAGKLWVSDAKSDTLQQFTLAGALLNVAHVASPTREHPGQPMAIYAAASGKLYVCDVVYQQVYVLAPAVTPASVARVAVNSLTAAASKSGGAQITFALSAPAAVDIEIDNIAGRPVRCMSGATYGQGLNTALWDGRNSSGAKAPSGTYLVRLTAHNASGQQANSVARLSLTR
jgi:hypothetical protein